MSSKLWNESAGWRWTVTVTILLTGMSILIALKMFHRIPVSYVASYTTPPTLAQRSGSVSSPAGVVSVAPNQNSTSVSIPPVLKNNSVVGKNGHNPAFDFPVQTASDNIFPTDTELHMIGVYEGGVPKEEENKPWWSHCVGLEKDSTAMMECHRKYATQHAVRPVTVDVSRFSVPLVLVLMAYEPIVWNISIQPNTKIKKIYICGYYGQDIKGVPNDIPIEVRTYEASPCQNCSRAADYFYAYKEDSQEYINATDKIKKITGLNPYSFQGSYKGNHFSINNNSGNRTANSSSKERILYTGKTFIGQIEVQGSTVLLPEGSWLCLYNVKGPSNRGPDEIIVLGRANGKSIHEIIALRIQKVKDGNGFSQFSGCGNATNYTSQVKMNESYGSQLCYNVVHTTEAWSQPLFVQVKKILQDRSVVPPELVIAISFHKADKNQAIDFLTYALPDSRFISANENWESSAWHPNNYKPDSYQSLFSQAQVNWAAKWFPFFSIP